MLISVGSVAAKNQTKRRDFPKKGKKLEEIVHSKGCFTQIHLDFGKKKACDSCCESLQF